MNEKLNAGIRRQYGKSRRSGNALAEDLSLERIHEFRVGTKRLRALLRLAADARGSLITGKLPKNQRVLYTMAGVIRTLQLQKQAIKDAAGRMHRNVPVGYLARLDDRIGIAEQMIRLYLQTSSPCGKIRAKWRHPIPGGNVDNAANSFIEKKTKVISLPPGSKLDDEQLHAIRKAVKDLLYVWPHFSKRNIDRAIANGLPSRDKLTTVAQLLGEFHDITVRLSLLQDRSLLNCMDPSDEKFLEDARIIWSRDRTTLIRKIRNGLWPASADPEQEIVTNGGENSLGPGNPTGAASFYPEVNAVENKLI